MSTLVTILILFTPPAFIGVVYTMYVYNYGIHENLKNQPFQLHTLLLTITAVYPLIVMLGVAWCSDNINVFTKDFVLVTGVYYLCEAAACVMAYGIFTALIADSLMRARIKHIEQQCRYNIDLCKQNVGDYVVTITRDVYEYREDTLFEMQLHTVVEEYDGTGVYNVLKRLEHCHSSTSFTQKNVTNFINNHFNSAVAYDIVINDGVAIAVDKTKITPSINIVK